MMYAELRQIVCEDCAELKPVRFYKTQKKCSECAAVARAKSKATRRAGWRKNESEHYRNLDKKHDLKKHYRMTLEQYEEMKKVQNSRCACCGDHEDNFHNKLHVDHDHSTGQIRGLLCTRCNPGIGYFKDSIERLEQAIAYLRKFKKLG